MALVSRLISVYLLLTSILGVAKAAPRPLVNHASIRETNSGMSSISLTPMYLTGTTHTKRMRQSVGTWGEEYALPYGWSVTVSTMSIFMDFGSQAAADYFDNFYGWLQVNCAARMLNNSPYMPRITAGQGQWKLILGMHPHSTVQHIEWSFVYYFATYMRNWVQNGYTGTGAIMFKHTSGIMLVAFFVNVEGSLSPVVH